MPLQKTEIAPGLYALDAALYVAPLNLLAISDLQLGREEELRKAGGLVIDVELADMKRRLSDALEVSRATRVLINGDLKHEFGTINEQESRSVLELLTFLREKGALVLVVKGNHDALLGPILRTAGIGLFEEFAEGGLLFCHGHALPSSQAFKKAKTVIIGHEHPALILSDGLRQEASKCFLRAPLGRKSLIVMPSFSRATEGTDLLKLELLSPLLTPAVLRKAEVFLVLEGVVKRAGTHAQIENALKRF